MTCNAATSSTVIFLIYFVLLNFSLFLVTMFYHFNLGLEFYSFSSTSFINNNNLAVYVRPPICKYIIWDFKKQKHSVPSAPSLNKFTCGEGKEVELFLFCEVLTWCLLGEVNKYHRGSEAHMVKTGLHGLNRRKITQQKTTFPCYIMCLRNSLHVRGFKVLKWQKCFIYSFLPPIFLLQIKNMCK